MDQISSWMIVFVWFVEVKIQLTGSCQGVPFQVLYIEIVLVGSFGETSFRIPEEKCESGGQELLVNKTSGASFLSNGWIIEGPSWCINRILDHSGGCFAFSLSSRGHYQFDWSVHFHIIVWCASFVKLFECHDIVDLGNGYLVMVHSKSYSVSN